MSEITKGYWMAGRNWNELRDNNWHDGFGLTTETVDNLKTESPEGGIIAYWDDETEGDELEDAKTIEW